MTNTPDEKEVIRDIGIIDRWNDELSLFDAFKGGAIGERAFIEILAEHLVNLGYRKSPTPPGKGVEQ